MKNPSNADLGQKRIHNRVACRSEGEIVLPDGSRNVQLLDISSGGCKLKFPVVQEGLPLVDQLPVEFVLTQGPSSVPGAFIWYSGNMFGCHFFDHILLDLIAEIMAGGFRIRLLPKSSQRV